MKSFNRDNLSVKIFDTRSLMGEYAAAEVSKKINELLKEKKEINMIFAAAPSQNEFLASLAADRSIDFSRINAFHMDEYIGLEKNAPQGFGNFLKDHIFGLAPFKSVNYINGQAADYEAECKRYGDLLSKTEIDIVCLGIGENGHIAFNDPHVADFNDKSYVKVVDLDMKCRQQQVNDGCFSQLFEVPKNAFTLTIPAMTSAKYMFCMVPAKTKAQAVHDTIFAPIGEECPATILRTKKEAKLYIDRDSASLLEENAVLA